MADRPGGEDDAALAAFCHREYPRLVGALTLYCGDGHVAQELAQEALVRACERWSGVRQMRAPGAWVHRVAMNLANSRSRRRTAELRAHARHGPHPQVSLDADAGEALAVRRAVSRLPRTQRTVLVARFYLGWSVAETAEWLGLSCDAVSAHASRGLKQLRLSLASDGQAARALGGDTP